MWHIGVDLHRRTVVLRVELRAELLKIAMPDVQANFEPVFATCIGFRRGLLVIKPPEEMDCRADRFSGAREPSGPKVPFEPSFPSSLCRASPAGCASAGLGTGRSDARPSDGSSAPGETTIAMELYLSQMRCAHSRVKSHGFSSAAFRWW
jgi:hypothetical protein